MWEMYKEIYHLHWKFFKSYGWKIFIVLCIICLIIMIIEWRKK